MLFYGPKNLILLKNFNFAIAMFMTIKTMILLLKQVVTIFFIFKNLNYQSYLYLVPIFKKLNEFSLKY